MLVVDIDSVELEMTFPEQYPFEPPFVQVVRPHLTGGYIISGAICMELLTKDGWNPVNDIETVIVSIRSHIVMGKARLKAVNGMAQSDYDEKLARKIAQETGNTHDNVKQESRSTTQPAPKPIATGEYTREQARAGFASIESIHKEKGWSNRGRRKG
jgi:ubiquitin-conjugating enzyme E2 Q